MEQTTKERYAMGDKDLALISALSGDAHCKIALLMKTLGAETAGPLELSEEEKNGLFYFLEDLRDMVKEISSTVIGEEFVRRV